MISPRRSGALLAVLAVLAVLLARPGPILAQIKAPTERLNKLEPELEELKAKQKKLEKEIDELKAAQGVKKGDEAKGLFSDGILTLGGVKLKLGGKAEILFIDTASERDTVVGVTDNPDPHFELNRLRLSPVLIFNKEVSLHSQIDLKPEQGTTILKELTARHKADPAWWFGSEVSLGLDDRFIRPVRRTKNYPLLGNAFWRDEEVALSLALRFGDRNGEPRKRTGKGTREEADGAAAGRDAVAETAEGEPVDVDAPDSGSDPAAVFREKRRREQAPFDFSKNLGEVRTYFSIGNGYTLNNNEVGFDGAPFDDLIQDDRGVSRDLTIREVGVGLGYARSFTWLGEAEVLGFYYNDELNSRSREFLRQDLTIRDPVTGAPTAGYGDSNLRGSYRYGVGGEYSLPASSFLPAGWKPRGGDGLRVQGQWIQAKDGRMGRRGWYLQGSYRYSFPKRLVADRYFRSIEPVVRYGELDTGVSPTALLPPTWDRKQILLGANLEVLKEVIFRVEYAFNREHTGGGGAAPGPGTVSNDELMLELLLQF